jgi:hypothetical protein
MKLQLVVLSCVFASTAAFAGPEKIKFPSDYLKGTLYQTLDRPDNKQYRELYATPAAIEAVRKGQPIPYGSVLTLVQWSVQQDDKGNPIKDSNGRFIKKDIIGHTVLVPAGEGQRDGGQGAHVLQQRRHAAPDHGGEWSAHRSLPARPEGLAHDRQARRVQLHLRAAPQHEGRDRSEVSEGK